MGYTPDGYATCTCGNNTLQIPVPRLWVWVELGCRWGYDLGYPGVYPCHCLIIRGIEIKCEKWIYPVVQGSVDEHLIGGKRNLITTIGYKRSVIVSTSEFIITSRSSPTPLTFTFPLCMPPLYAARAMYRVVLSDLFPPLQIQASVREAWITL